MWTFPQRSLRSSPKILFTMPIVNSVTYGERAFSFSAPTLYGTVYHILLKIQHLFHLLNLPSKHSSCFGNFIFDLFYQELYRAFMSPILNQLFCRFKLVYLVFLHGNVSALSFLNAPKNYVINIVRNFC